VGKKPSKGSEALRNWMADNACSVRALAEKLACSKSYVGMLKNGDEEPGLTVAVKIEQVCGIPPRLWKQSGAEPELDVAEQAEA